MVDRYHLRSGAKKLQELEKKAQVARKPEGKNAAADQLGAELVETYALVKEALWSRGRDEMEPDDDEPEKKLPSTWLPASGRARPLFGLVSVTALFFLGCHWSTLFKATMYYHASRVLAPGVTIRVVPHKHRGKPALVTVEAASDGALYFTYQRQYELLPAAGGSLGQVRALQCPTELPLGDYAAATGMGRAEGARMRELHGENSFAIPMPTFGNSTRRVSLFFMWPEAGAPTSPPPPPRSALYLAFWISPSIGSCFDSSRHRSPSSNFSAACSGCSADRKYTMCAPHHLEGGLRPVLPECRATTLRSCAHAHRAVGRFTLFMILAFDTTPLSRARGTCRRYVVCPIRRLASRPTATVRGNRFRRPISYPEISSHSSGRWATMRRSCPPIACCSVGAVRAAARRLRPALCDRHFGCVAAALLRATRTGRASPPEVCVSPQRWSTSRRSPASRCLR